MPLVLATLILAVGPTPELGWAEKEAIARGIIEAERANVVRGDADAYLAAFSPDARWIHARGAEVKTSEDVLPAGEVRERIALRRERKITGGVRHQDVDVQSLGPDQALLTMTTLLHRPGWILALHEEVRLTREGDRWLAVEDRFYPLWERRGETVTTYDKATWKAIDAARLAARRTDPLGVEQLSGLLEARYFVEALAIAGPATERQPLNARLWALRAQAAFEMGEVDEARQAARRARQLDPAVELEWSLKP